MTDIVCFGEAVIDFISSEKGLSLIQAEKFIKSAGGAPANVAVGVSRLGAESMFVGKVGSEQFGYYLKATLEAEGVNTSNLILDRNAKTTLAFVVLDEKGVPDFALYRNPGADTLLSEEEIHFDSISEARIFHYGSISLVEGPTRETLLSLLRKLQKKVFLSYDPNLRLPLWKDEEHARGGILEGLKFANLVKVSKEELSFITEEKEIHKGIRAIHKYGPSSVFVTLGSEGAIASNGLEHLVVPSKKALTLDTTGAGDAFVAAILYSINQTTNVFKALEQRNELQSITAFANRVAALSTENYGAMESLPHKIDLQNE